MQADAMYPEQCRRNYRNFVDGFIKVAQEGALYRGALANGFKYAGLVSVGGGMYDWVKENMFYFLGPISALRIIGTAVGVGCATAVSMPFDTVRTRLHTMRPLPNGEYPYRGFLDCATKMYRYECAFEKHNNFGSFYTGGQAYFLRLYGIAMIS